MPLSDSDNSRDKDQQAMPSSPRVWLLLGHKAGDNAQVLALAEALGWPCESKHMVYRRTELVTNRMLGTSLAGIKKHDSSSLKPPWPDLVISAGRRNEPVARWIKKQASSPVRLVHFGRTWAPARCFDLIITTPQYKLPAGTNVLQNNLPLHHITADKIAAAKADWLPRLEHLPRPYIAVLVGGHSSAHSLTTEKAALLGRQAMELARKENGSLLITTSMRTPASVISALQAVIDMPNYFYHWQVDDSENPYIAYLALADKFIVTGDSVSMLAEACMTRKPVYIFPGSASTQVTGRSGISSLLSDIRGVQARVAISRIANRLAPRRMIRDIGVIHRQLLESGRAAWLGESFTGAPVIPPQDDLEQATARVRSLFDSANAD